MSWNSRRESPDTGRSRSIWNSGLDTVGTQGSSHRATKPTAKCMDHMRGDGGTLVVGLALGLSRGRESLAEIGIRSPRVGATPQRINLACLVVLTHPKPLHRVTCFTAPQHWSLATGARQATSLQYWSLATGARRATAPQYRSLATSARRAT